MNNPESLSQGGEISENEWEKVMEKMAQRDAAKDESEPAHAPGYEYLADEDISEHETNLNSKTGKERTFSDMDLYAINSYDNGAEQSEHRKDRNDWTVWTEFIKKPGLNELGNKTSQEANQEYFETIQNLQAQYPRTEGETASEYHDRVEGIVESITEKLSPSLDREAETERLKQKLENAVKEGRMSKEHAESLMYRQLDRYVDQKVEESKNNYSEEELVNGLLNPESIKQPEPVSESIPEDTTEAEENPELDRRISEKEAEIAAIKAKLEEMDQLRAQAESEQQDIQARREELERDRVALEAAGDSIKSGSGNRFSILSFLTGLRKKREKRAKNNLDQAA